MTAIEVWIIVGLVLMAMELLLPGAVVAFLGFSALVVAGLIYMGVLEGPVQAVTAYFVISIFFLFFIRGFFTKFFEGDTSTDNTDEDLDLQGSLVVVTDSIEPHTPGRVKLQESTWNAQSEQTINSGESARVVARDGNTLIVEPI